MTQSIDAFFTEKVPGEWFTQPVRVEHDQDEILVIGTLPDGSVARQFREATRAERVAIAGEAESLYRRKVSWGVESGGETTLFTTVALPTMTRLRFPERRILDTLVEAGVARSRADALGWCVRLVGRHQSEWLSDLREALGSVERVRAEGPVQL